MKKLLSAILLLTMLLSLVSFPFESAANETKNQDTSIEASDELPVSTTLVGSKHLPPISNQGDVGCCASASIAYMQFTNAVSRYIEANEPDKTFDPSSGNRKYLMSPKFTYFLSGSGTAYVYNILLENGCLTMDQSSFFYNDKRGYTCHHWSKEEKLHPEFCDWDVKEGEMERALDYRLTDYEQIWVSNDNYRVNGKVQLTSTEQGQALIKKIKRSLLDGNVVVTGGLAGTWTGYTTLTQNGAIGKRGEYALAVSQGDRTGGHQVCIVGYDDNIQCICDGEILTGGFLVANSWGSTWMNDGYVWVMYDALNEHSDYPQLNYADRCFTMDQFCFTDWRTDITTGKPDLYVELTVTATNRDTVYAETLREDRMTGVKEQESYFMFNDRLHPDVYNDEHQHGSYFNFAGEVDGEATKGIIALSYNELLNVGTQSFSDYRFGFSLCARKGDYVAHSAVLKNAEGEVIAEMNLEDKIISGSTQEFYFEEQLFKVNVPSVSGAGYRVEGKECYYAKDGIVTFSVKAEEGYRLEEVQVNGQTLVPDEQGMYALSVQEDVTIQVEAKVTDLSKEVKIKSYRAFVTATEAEFYISFTEDSYGKEVQITFGNKSENVTAGAEGVCLVLSVHAPDEKIIVNYQGVIAQEYSLRAYLMAVETLEGADAAQKAVASAILEGKEYKEYLTVVKEEQND